jgi:hypothetical protein
MNTFIVFTSIFSHANPVFYTTIWARMLRKITFYARAIDKSFCKTILQCLEQDSNNIMTCVF